MTSFSRPRWSGRIRRPQWFKQQLLGRDIRVAFKEVQHEEAYNDAVATVIRDQEEAGLDIVTDGNMWYDDYVGVIGSFCWYIYERIGGFEPSREAAPLLCRRADAQPGQDDHGRLGRRHQQRPGRHTARSAWPTSTRSRPSTRQAPVKVSVGAGPANLAWHVYFKHYKNAKELSFALAPIFNKEMKDLVAAGAKYLQFEDLGAWLPLFTNNKDDYKWIREVVEQCCDGVDAKIGWHFCFGNAWGNDILSANYPEGYQTVLPYFFGTAGIDEFVLDYANRDMAGVEFLKNLPANQGVQLGVLDIRTNAIEPPAEDRRPDPQGDQARPADKVTLSTRLRHEAAGPHGGEDEAQCAGRGCCDRPQGSRGSLESIWDY